MDSVVNNIILVYADWIVNLIKFQDEIKTSILKLIKASYRI